MQFFINADTIKALLLIAAKGDRRTYLNGICIDVRHSDAVAVVTNGHKLMAVPVTLDADTPAVSGQYIIGRDVLDSFKAGKGAHVSVTINATARTVTLTAGGSTLTATLLDERYPEWRRVVPLTCSGEVAQFDAEYVGAFGKAHKLMGGKYSPSIAHNGNDAARILLAGDAIGVLMPFRETDATPKLSNPNWLLTAQTADMAEAA